MRRVFTILLAILVFSSFVSAQKIESVTVEVHRYDGDHPCGSASNPVTNMPITVEDSWGKFNGVCSYLGPYYYYTTILVKLDNGARLRYLIALKDNRGNTIPAPTVLGNANGPDKREQTQNYNIGDSFWIWMNDNWDDNNYIDGKWLIKVEETSIQAIYATEGGGYWHNSSIVVMNVDTGENWTIPLPYKPSGVDKRHGYTYNFTIPTDGSPASVTDNYRGETSTYVPPAQIFVAPPKKAPIPLGTIILAMISMFVLIAKKET